MISETEFNGSFERSDVLQDGKTVVGNLFDSSDVDYFIYENATTGTLEVAFDSATDWISYDSFSVSIVDDLGNVIYGEASGKDIDFAFPVKKSGSYYIVVAPGYHDDGAYNLTVTHTNSLASHSELDEIESNNSFTNANLISSSDVRKGQLYSSDDTDFYSVLAVEPGTISIQFNAPIGGAETYDSFSIELLDNEQNILNKKDTSHSILLDTEIGEPGNYFVKISSKYPYEDGIYSLKIDAPYNGSPNISTAYKYYYGEHGQTLAASLDGLIYSDLENDNWTLTALKLISQDLSAKQLTADYSTSSLPYNTWLTYENVDIPNIQYTRPDQFAVNEVKAVAYDGNSWSNELSTYLVSVAEVISGDDADNDLTATIGSKDSYVINGFGGYDKLEISLPSQTLDFEINYNFSADEDYNQHEIFLLNFEEITYHLTDADWSWYAESDLVERVRFGEGDDSVRGEANGDFYYGGSGSNRDLMVIYLPTTLDR